MEVLQPNSIWRIQPGTSRRSYKSASKYVHFLTKLFTSAPAKAARGCRIFKLFFLTTRTRMLQATRPTTSSAQVQCSSQIRGAA